MEYLLFVAYLVFFAWLVTKVTFFRLTGLSKAQIVIIFLLKIMAGIFYGWIGLYYGDLAQMQDTWSFHVGGIQEYHLLYNDPHEYFTNLFRDPYDGGVNKFFDSNDSYWNDLKGNIFIKILSIFDIFSFGHYYVNVIFYSFVTLFGVTAIYRVMNDVFPGRKTTILIATFLVPSFLYWSSGLHKEGLIFTGMSLVIYVVYFFLKDKRISVKRLLSFTAGLLLMLALRNFIIIILLPALAAWITANRFPKYKMAIFAGMYLLFVLFFFNARHINPNLDFPQAVVNKQHAFLKLAGGHSSVPMTQVEPTAISFLQNTPQAINLSAIRPYPSDVRHILSLAAATEINTLLLLFVIFLFFHYRKKKPEAITIFCIFFSATFLLSIGFSVNNLGAIVRYRSIILPLLVIPMAAGIDWDRLLQFLNIKGKNNIKNSEQTIKIS